MSVCIFSLIHYSLDPVWLRDFLVPGTKKKSYLVLIEPNRRDVLGLKCRRPSGRVFLGLFPIRPPPAPAHHLRAAPAAHSRRSSPSPRAAPAHRRRSNPMLPRELASAARSSPVGAPLPHELPRGRASVQSAPLLLLTPPQILPSQATATSTRPAGRPFSSSDWT